MGDQWLILSIKNRMCMQSVSIYLPFTLVNFCNYTGLMQAVCEHATARCSCEASWLELVNLKAFHILPTAQVLETPIHLVFPLLFRSPSLETGSLLFLLLYLISALRGHSLPVIFCLGCISAAGDKVDSDQAAAVVYSHVSTCSINGHQHSSPTVV